MGSDTDIISAQHFWTGGLETAGHRLLRCGRDHSGGGFPNAGYEPHPSCDDRSLTARSRPKRAAKGIQALDRLTRPRPVKGGNVRGLNFFSHAKQTLLSALQRPAFNFAGFRRADLLPTLAQCSPAPVRRHIFDFARENRQRPTSFTLIARKFSLLGRSNSLHGGKKFPARMRGNQRSKRLIKLLFLREILKQLPFAWPEGAPSARIIKGPSGSKNCCDRWRRGMN
jgi:hypothetical protein